MLELQLLIMPQGPMRSIISVMLKPIAIDAVLRLGLVVIVIRFSEHHAIHEIHHVAHRSTVVGLKLSDTKGSCHHYETPKRPKGSSAIIKLIMDALPRANNIHHVK
jgi:hypothetical protein